ncbi:MAG: thioredoxin domain-containing protein [Paenisporosarcina sp.]|nr:thioredoxin domain-containing protein [Paenisporosarcina sp.]
MKNSNMKFAMIVTIIAAALLVVIVVMSSNKGQDQELVLNKLDVDLTGQPTLGEEDAPVTVVEFGDFKCPSCKAWGETVYPQIVEDYLLSGDVKFSYVNVLFHGEESTTGALAAESVFKQDPDSFWDFHKAVFDAQPEVNHDDIWLSQEKMLEIAKDYPSVDQDQLKRDMEEGLTKPQVDIDEKLYTKHEVTQTPTIKINGITIENPFDYEKIKEMIDQELEANRNE